MYHYIDSGLKNVWLESGYTIHQTECGEGVSIHDLDGLHKIIGLDIAEKTLLLDGDDVRFLRKEMDLTQNSLAAMLRVTEDSIRNYESGRSSIQAPTEILLRKLYLEHVNDDGTLSDLIKEISRLNREIAGHHRVIVEHERQFSFEKDAWKAA
jgi:putative transcriptional regulator